MILWLTGGLKAKYFPMCDFLNAPLGNNPSYTWRSIWVAKDLVKFGSRWRIGNGEKVKIWGDKWLPTLSTFRVSSPRLFLDPDSRVGELITAEETSWNSEAISAPFMPHEAEVIRSIPLSIRLPEDKLIWAPSFNGLFSVRSAYYGALEMGRSGNGGSC